MLTYPVIDPVAFYLGSWPVHWYGLMYLVGFLSAWVLLTWRAHAQWLDYNAQQVSDIVFYSALAAIIGGRVGYMVFYDFQNLIADPWTLFKMWRGGMSFHGGLLGVAMVLYFQAKQNKKSWLDITDFVAPVVPIGLGAGRIGNFINGELWGRATDLPWGMVFPRGGAIIRHPSPLYEFFLEGVVLFLILWIYSMKPRPKGAVSGLFLVGYGLFRSFAECFREPDAHLGFLMGWITQGQLLSLPMILIGLLLLFWAYTKKQGAL